MREFLGDANVRSIGVGRRLAKDELGLIFGAPRRMVVSSTEAERRLAAIMMADMVGYSRMVEADERHTLATLRTLRSEVIDPSIARHHGRIVKLTGDGFLVEFASVVAAVAAAVDMQKGVAAEQVDIVTERRIVFRIGVNLGDVIVDGDDLIGDGVNVAARLEQHLPAGRSARLRSAYDQLDGKLEIVLQAMGEHHVKNIARPIRVYGVRPARRRHVAPRVEAKPRRLLHGAWPVLVPLAARRSRRMVVLPGRTGEGHCHSIDGRAALHKSQQ